MICPRCRFVGSRVVDSRDMGGFIRRRRECERCGERFSTSERVELRMPQVVKKSGVREAFDHDKLRGSLQVACRKRPVSGEALEECINRIEQKVREDAERGEIASQRVGALVLDELLALDRVAYLRFASVYQELASPEAFLVLLRPLLGEAR